MAEFRMPSLGADMEAGTVVSWLVSVGEHVTRGDVVAEVDTEKSVIDVETFTTGTVEEILVGEGERVPVGTPLAIIREDVPAGEAGTPAPPTTAREPAEPTTAPQPAEPTTAPEPVPVAAVAAGAPSPGAAPRVPEQPTRPPGRVVASPRARRLAQDLGVDLASVVGTGPDGVVTAEDVEAAAARAASGPAPVAPLSGEERRAALRRAVGASMARSKREIPHYYLATDIDVTGVVRWLEAHNAAVPITDRLLPVVPLLKATALALRETPDLNGFWEGDAFRASEGVHLGVAIAMKGGGLVAPAIHDADRMGLADLMRALHDLVTRARTGGLRATEMAEPTITVTSLGDQGVDAVFPVIYPPQVAIVGFGRIRERPWVSAGSLGVAHVVTATLAADHRASDGHRGAMFLAVLDRLLQNPEALA